LSALHKWWAQRPLAAASAVIFAQLVDDPSSHPDLFPSEDAQQAERERLFAIIRDLVQWENTTNEAVLERARAEIRQSWEWSCAANAGHPSAKELFDPGKLPAFYDPFAGGGSLPLEAQRLGLEAYASDLNPVAVLINKAMIEIPPKFAGRPPVNPEARSNKALFERQWLGSQGLAEDVRYYGRWILDEATRRIGHLYPMVEVGAEMAADRPRLKPYIGKKLPVIAWLWARTVKSPDPAFSCVDIPLAATFQLSTRAGKEAYVQPIVDGSAYWFTVKDGPPKDPEAVRNGTKLARGANFRCLMSGTPVSDDYIKAESRAGRLGARLLATVADCDAGRIYLPPTPDMEEIALGARPEWKPDVEFFQHALGFRVGNYGMTVWSDLFTDRQLVGLSTFSDLVQELRERVRRDAETSGLCPSSAGLGASGTGALAYADAIAVYAAFAVSKVADYNCSLVPWYAKEDRPSHLFSKQTISMIWDYTELNPLSSIGGSFDASIKIVSDSLEGCNCSGPPGHVEQRDAVDLEPASLVVFSTDPPYYDNVGYADLSDFFYVWLRRSLKPVYPELFGTLTTPKNGELVATPDRHGGKDKAESYFLRGMTKAMHRLAEWAHPCIPVSIYYAFRQSENDSAEGIASTGWETFLEAVVRAGFALSATWPMRTERLSRARGIRSNALASSIIVVCRPRDVDAPNATRRDFIVRLKAELPIAIKHLQSGNIAPVDLAQAAIGPGMAVYTRYDKVVDAAGNALSVREALALINQTLDEVLAEQEGDFDSDTRWALAWFEQSGFAEDSFGEADKLSKAKNTSVAGMVRAGIVASGGGKVRLLRPAELPPEWDPSTDNRLTAWECVHHLVRALDAGGEGAAAALVAKLGSNAEIARELAYRLYTICERKKRAPEALSYNSLVQSWPEITRLARESTAQRPSQIAMF
jgi:putative DNA methylase